MLYGGLFTTKILTIVQAALGSAGILKIEIGSYGLRVTVWTIAILASFTQLSLPWVNSDLLRWANCFCRSSIAMEQHVQVAAITAIGQLDYQPAIPLLIRRLEAVCELLTRHRSQLNVATRFLHTLVALEAREAIPLFIRIARDEVGLRGLAVQGLIELRAEEAAPALLPMLSQLLDSQHEEKLCCRLLYLMTVVDYRFAMPTVRAFLGHRQPGIRCAALKAVASWKDRDALDGIRLIASADVSAFVRPAA
jgi:hypothetical protein